MSSTLSIIEVSVLLRKISIAVVIIFLLFTEPMFGSEVKANVEKGNTLFSNFSVEIESLLSYSPQDVQLAEMSFSNQAEMERLGHRHLYKSKMTIDPNNQVLFNSEIDAYLWIIAGIMMMGVGAILWHIERRRNMILSQKKSDETEQNI